MFSNSCTKTLRKYSKIWTQWSSLLIKLQDYSVELTSELKTSLQILFWKCAERTRNSKISKIFKLSQNCPFLSNVIGLQTRISDFNKIILQEKCFAGEKCSEIVKNFAGKTYFEIFWKLSLLEYDVQYTGSNIIKNELLTTFLWEV